MNFWEFLSENVFWIFLIIGGVCITITEIAEMLIK